MWQKQEYEMPADVLFARPTNRAIKSGLVFKDDQPNNKIKTKHKYLLVKVQIASAVVILMVTLVSKALFPGIYEEIRLTYSSVMYNTLTAEQEQAALDIINLLPQAGTGEIGSDSTVGEADDTSTVDEQTDDTIVPPTSVTEQSAQGSEEIAYEKFISNPTSESEYQLQIPIVSPVETGRITSEFGSRISPITGMPEFHSGLDLASAEGTEIMSVADGIIQDAGYDSVAGYYVKIDHSDGFVSSYSHLDSYSVEAGDEITAGEVLGIMGTTGASTGVHLHLSFILDGVRVNPEYAYPDGIFK